MTTTITTTTDNRLPRLLAWLSPAFPTGAFAYSHGLEWAIEAGDSGCPSATPRIDTTGFLRSRARSAALISVKVPRAPPIASAMVALADGAAHAAELGRVYRGLSTPAGPVRVFVVSSPA